MDMFHPCRESLALAITSLDMWEEEFHDLLPEVHLKLGSINAPDWVEVDLGIEFDAEYETEHGFSSEDEKEEGRIREVSRPPRHQLRSLASQMPQRIITDTQLYRYII